MNVLELEMAEYFVNNNQGFMLNNVLVPYILGGQLNPAANVYISQLIDKPDEIVGFFETGGIEPDKYLPLQNPTKQVYVRARQYLVGKQIVSDVVKTFHQNNNLFFVNGATYSYYCLLLGEPAHIGQDETKRNEWTINFQLLARR